jgi:hypothetical protein
MMRLAIENEHLVVKIRGAIGGFSADDISFVVENWVLVNELWPSKLPVSVSRAPELPKPASAAQKLIQELTIKIYPNDTWRHASLPTIRETVGKEIKAKGLPVPGEGTFRRALGLKKR